MTSCRQVRRLSVLIDSNILFYAFDPRNAEKQAKAQQLLEPAEGMMDTCSAFRVSRSSGSSCRRRLRELVTPEVLDTYTARLLELNRVFPVDGTVVKEGLRGRREHQLSYWDSFMWAVAKLNDIPYILSEDGQHRRLVDGVRYLNPFHDDFERAELGLSRK